jgi:aspartyl-tRNA synthetase
VWQVCDVVDRLFVAMFDHLNKNCARELEAIQRQYPFKPLKARHFMLSASDTDTGLVSDSNRSSCRCWLQYLEATLRLDYDQGIRMLQEAGVHVDPMGDLNTEAEKKLGELVRDK